MGPLERHTHPVTHVQKDHTSMRKVSKTQNLQNAERDIKNNTKTNKKEKNDTKKNKKTKEKKYIDGRYCEETVYLDM